MTGEHAKPSPPTKAEAPADPPALTWHLLPSCVAALSVAAVAIALVSQYKFGMQPCPWCAFQRLLFLLVAAAAVLCVLGPRFVRGWPAAGLALSFSVAGAASALWQHFVASKSGSCAMTVADRILDGLGLFTLLPSVFEPKASCAEAAVDLFGLPYEMWSLGLFLICGGLLLIFLLKSFAARIEAGVRPDP